MNRVSLVMCIIISMHTAPSHTTVNAQSIHAYMCAHYFQKKQDYTQAQQWFDCLFQKPMSPFAYKGYIEYLFTTGQYNTVVSLIPKSQELQNDESTQLFFAQSLLHVGKIDEAHKRIIALSMRFKNNQFIAFQAAQIYIQKKEITNALTTIDTYLNSCPRRPNNFVFYFLKSQAYAHVQNIPRALENIIECINIFPAFDKGWLLYGILQELAGNLSQAIKGFSTYLSLNQTVHKEIQQHVANLLMQQKIAVGQSSNHQQINFHRALTHCQRKEYKAAIAQLDLCLKAEPNHTQARLLKVQLETHEREYQSVTSALQSWILEDPSQGLWYQTAYLLHKNMRFPHEKLLAIYQNIVAKKPESLLAHLYLSDYYIKADKLDAALTSLQKSYQLCNDNELKTKIAYQMGLIWYEQKAYAKAKDILLAAEALKTEFPPLLNLLAYYFASKERNFAEATPRITRALELDPHNPHFQDTQAIVWYKQGQFQKALSILQQAHQTCPDDPVVARHLMKVSGQCKVTSGQSLPLTCNNTDPLSSK